MDIDVKNELALDIITNEIAKLFDEYAFNKDEEKNKKIEDKIKILEKIKEEIYLNNEKIIENVLEKQRKGIFNEK